MFGAFKHVEAPNREAQQEADRVLLSRFAPTSVVINEDFEISQFRGHTGRYLEPASGQATLNLLKMARTGLYRSLREVVIKAKERNTSVKKTGIEVKQNAHSIQVNLEVVPLKRAAEGARHFLVIFEPAAPPPRRGRESGARRLGEGSPKGVMEARPGKGEEREVSRVKMELAETKAHLQALAEEHQAYAEELQASNEEAQASNEELQSINEELETSKEELQATNEELGTINAELHARNAELGRANEDLTNLLGSVRLPIVMVGVDLRIRRFNGAAANALNLISTDTGRPIGNLRPPVEGLDLEGLLAEVIRDAVVKESEVRDRKGHWFLLRAHPYRTSENKIDGAILLLIDIDELKRTTESRDYSRAIINTLHEPLVVLRADLRVNTANRAFYQMLGSVPEETEGRSIYELGQGQWNVPQIRELLEQTIPHHYSFNDIELTQEFRGLGRRTLLLNARQLQSATGQGEDILLVMEDITDRRKSEVALRASELRYRRLFESAEDGILILNPHTQKNHRC